MGNRSSRKKYTDLQKKEIRRLWNSLKTKFDETSGALRSLVFFFSVLTFSLEQYTDLHLQLLRSTWRAMHPERDFQRKDVRWKDIGFQGEDPVTDIRAGGVLALA